MFPIALKFELLSFQFDNFFSSLVSYSINKIHAWNTRSIKLLYKARNLRWFSASSKKSISVFSVDNLFIYFYKRTWSHLRGKLLINEYSKSKSTLLARPSEKRLQYSDTFAKGNTFQLIKVCKTRDAIQHAQGSTLNWLQGLSAANTTM